MTHQNGITNQTSNTAQSSSFLSTFWQPKQETSTTEVITSTEEVESVSFTWSPVPPRRATHRAAQSLCLTLYCDDSLDDMTQNIKLPSSNKNTPAKKKTLRDVLNSPSDLESEDLGGASVFSIFDPYVPTNKPMNLRSRAAYLLNAGTPELGKSQAAAFNAIAKATASLAGQHFDGKNQTAMPSTVNVGTSEDDGFPFPEETERDCVSPLHISHTPYSPIPSCSRESNRATYRKDVFKTSSNVDGSSSTTVNDESLGARVKTKRQSKRQSTRERRSRSQFNSPYGMYLASLETRKTDASLTAHLPPWHSIGNISLSYKKSASQENLHRRKCIPSASSTTDTFDTEESRVTFDLNGHSFLQSSTVESTQLGSKPLDLPLKTTDGSYSVFKKEEETSLTAANSMAKTPVSPSDSILSTGFQLGSVTASQLKPSTHPQDTPTHSPTKKACPGVTRRTQPSTDTQDLRLDSIHDLSWLNKMEPEEQTLLEVHVIWSILSLMVVLLACYSLHQPFNR